MKCPRCGKEIEQLAHFVNGSYEICPGYPKKSTIYKCLKCDEVFDTKTAKGKMHMAKHGLNLKYALKNGLVKRLEQ